MYLSEMIALIATFLIAIVVWMKSSKFKDYNMNYRELYFPVEGKYYHYGCLLFLTLSVVFLAMLLTNLELRFLNLLGLSLDGLGFVQALRATFFSSKLEELITKFADKDQIPSSVVRLIIDNPDEDELTKSLRRAYDNPHIGVLLVAVGFLFQMIASALS